MKHSPNLLCSSLLFLLQSCNSTPPAPTIQGAWYAETYGLVDGSQHEVRGNILFTESDWSVLFFVMSDGQARRGSGEGGRYSLEAEDRLVFHHLYHLSYGEALSGLPASPLKMQLHEAGGVAEPCRFSLEEDRLQLFFPSGNSMTFRRSGS